MPGLSKKEKERLQSENASLRSQVAALKRDLDWQASVNRALQRSKSNVTLLPKEMALKFANLNFQIDLFISDLSTCLDVRSHREYVERAMRSAGSAKAFRETLTNNSDLRELAIQPLATDRQMWTAYIWRFLMQKVFSYDGIRTFYSSPGQNAAYYIKNIDEIEYLMRRENDTPADDFIRDAWRKQAIEAVFPTDNKTVDTADSGASLFPTGEHPWLASNRQAKIEELSAQLLRVFRVFARILPTGLDLMRNIVSHAVRFNEYMMHEAEVRYTLDLETAVTTHDEFLNSLQDVRMSTVNTDSGWMVNVDSAMKGMRQSEIRRRLYKVCAIEPALRYQSWVGSDALDLEYRPVQTEVKSGVAVGWALKRNQAPENESMFYIMAQSLGFVPPVESST